jgi:hypothetical protein
MHKKKLLKIVPEFQKKIAMAVSDRLVDGHSGGD